MTALLMAICLDLGGRRRFMLDDRTPWRFERGWQIDLHN